MADHKTYIPGIGMLVTSEDGRESYILPSSEFVKKVQSDLAAQKAKAEKETI